jgi:DNA transformation protein and related proteins
MNSQIKDLKSLGPKSQAMLAQAGITTVAQLRALGAVAAYVQTKRVNPKASLNLLWGLESALTGMPWQQVAREHRTSFLLAVEDMLDRNRLSAFTVKSECLKG